MPTRFKFKDVLDAFQFADSGGGIVENYAYFCKQSGEFYLHSSDLDGELPDGIDDGEKYLSMPDKRELDLGKPLALDFAREFLPDDFNHVRQIFSKSGAYARFKDLLVHRHMLNQWYDFEAKAEERALREWCEANSIDLED